MGKSIMQNVLCWDISSRSANFIQYQEFVISYLSRMSRGADLGFSLGRGAALRYGVTDW